MPPTSTRSKLCRIFALAGILLLSISPAFANSAKSISRTKHKYSLSKRYFDGGPQPNISTTLTSPVTVRPVPININFGNSAATELVNNNTNITVSPNATLQGFSRSYQLSYASSFGSLGNSDTQFNNVLYNYVDPNGNIYISDDLNNKVKVFDAARRPILTLGTGNDGSGDGDLNSPYGVSTDAAGRIYVVDQLNNRIQVFSSDGTFLKKFGMEGTADGQFKEPAGIDVDASGKIYVADKGNNRIQIFDSFDHDFTFLNKIGDIQGNTNLRFNTPVDVKVADDGGIYVADLNNNRIQLFKSDLSYNRTFTSGSLIPTGISLDGLGNLIVANDNYLTKLIVFRLSSGTILASYSSPGNGSGAGQFNRPQSVTTDRKGNIFIADLNNNRVQQFRVQDTYSASINPISAGTITVTLNAGAVKDAWGNPSSQGVFTIEYAPPALQTTLNSPLRDQSVDTAVIPLTYSVSKPADTLNTASFDITNGTVTHIKDSLIVQFQSIISNGFGYPTAVAVDNNGYIYGADGATDRILVFTEDGQFIRAFGSTGQGNGNFSLPAGLAYANGLLYVADEHNNRIEIVNSEGTYIDKFGSFGTGNGQFNLPSGVFLSTITNRIYVADQGNNRIQVFDLNTKGFILKFGTPGAEPGKLNAPTAVIADAAGNIYVTDGNNRRIQKFDANGNYIKTLSTAGQLSAPTALATDGGGRIYVTDATKNQLLVYTYNGTLLKAYGSGGGAFGLFNRPAGVTLDKNGKIYIADQGNGRIQVLASSDFYTADVIPGHDGDVIISVPANRIFDARQNGNAASSITVTYNNSAPDKPTGLTAAPLDTKAALTWNANSATDQVARYKIFYGTTVDATTFITVPSSQTSYTSQGLVNGTIYYYRISAIDVLGHESHVSDPVSVTPKANQTITVVQTVTGKKFGDAAFDITGVAVAQPSMLGVTYTVSEGPASITGNTVTLSGAGTVKIKVDQAGDTFFNAAPSVVFTFNVAKATAVILGTGLQNKPYTGAALSLSDVTLNHTEAALSYSPQQTYTDVGEHSITVSAPATDNYISVSKTFTLNIIPAEIPGVVFRDTSFIYDGGAKSINLIKPAGSSVVYNGPSSYTNAGDYVITGVVTNGPNYVARPIRATLHILVAPARNNFVFNSQEFEFDGNAHYLTVQNSEGANAVIPGNGQTDIGQYDLTAYITEPNHETVTKYATLKIIPPHNAGIVFPNEIFTYDGRAKYLTVANPNGTVSYEGNGQINAGTYHVKATVHRDNNQDTVVFANLVIKKADTQIAVSNQFTYDGTPHLPGIIMLNRAGAQAVLNDNTPQINAGAYNYTVSIAGDANYNPVTDFPITLKIDKAPSSITLNGGNFQVANYDGTAKTIRATLNRPGSTSSDLIFSPSGPFINKGLYTNIQISAAATPNYEAPQPVFASLQIVSGSMAPVFRDTTFTYDGTPKKIEVKPSSIPPGVNVSYDMPGNSFINADNYAVTAHITDPNGNYLPVTIPARLNIEKAVFTNINFNDASFTYDGTPKSLVPPVVPAFAQLTLSGNGKVNVGDYDVTATVTDASAHPNYNPFSITKKLSITVASIQNVVFKDTVFVYDGSAKSIAIAPASLPADAAVTYTGNDKVNVGDYEVSATVTEPNHQTRTFTAHFTITPADITGATFDEKIYTYDGNVKSLAASLPSGASVEYTNNDQTNVGVYRVKAHITAPNYNPLDLYAYLNIVAATSSGMVLPDVTYTYDGTVKALEVLNRLPNTDVTYTNNNQIEPGTYEVRATVTQAGYNDVNLTGHITIVKANVNITANALQIADYDGTNKNIAASISPPNHESQLVYTPQQGYTDAGDYTITVSAAETAHYNAPQSKQVRLRITTGSIITGVTLADRSFDYDGTTKSLSVDNLPADATVTYSNNSQTQAGSYTVTARVEQPNHQALTLTGQLTIVPVPITAIVFSDATFGYDGSPKNLSVSNLPADATVTYTGNQKINAGSYIVTAQISQPNHADLTLAATLHITRAQAQIIADADQTVNYDGTPKTVLARLNHNEAGLSFSPQQGYVDAGDYLITVSAPASANYLAVSKQVTLHINPVPVTGVTFRDADFNYDGTPRSIAVGNLPAGSSVVYTGNNQTNAGTYTVTAVIIQPNHQDLTLTAKLTIHAAPITGVVFSDNTFVYDGTTKNLSVQNVPPNSTITYSNNGQVNAGNYTVTAKIHQDSNHDDLVLNAALVINKAALTATADNISRPYNTANPPFTISFRGFKGNDNVSSSFTALPVASAEANTSSPVGTYPINISSGSSPNYALTYIPGTLTVTITNRALTFNPFAVKTYGDPDFDAGGASSSGETVIYTSSNASIATVVNGKVHITGAGTAIITATLPENANYSNTPFISQSLVINKANQTIALSSIPVLIKGDKYDLNLIKSSSGLPITFITIDQSIAHVEGQNLNALHIGVTNMIASQAGDNNYNPAKDVIVPVIVKDGNGNEFIVHQALSPNGDGVNDFLYIEGIQQYINNRITIIDRNGTKVYEASGYDNANKVFNGHSNITGQLLTPGTYFYLVEYINEKGEGRHETGYFVLKY